jgi:serine/threonine protein kinase
VGVIHRDLKPANILVSQTEPLGGGRRTMPTVKISDFGTATRVCEAQAMRRSCVGTPWFLSPEVIQVEEYSFPADIWSIGCCLFNLVVGRRPYHELNAMQCIFRMVTEDHPPIPAAAALSDECRAFIMACWRRDWRTRPTAVELMEHPFIVNNMRI